MNKKSDRNSKLKKKREGKNFLNVEDNSIHSSFKRDKALWIIVSIVFLLVLYIRIRLLSTPLERDEGEYAYMGQLILKGIIPFKDVYTMKLPGTSMMYALIMFLLGQTTLGIHIGLLLINVGSVFFLFLLYKRWTDSNSKALIAASIFAFLAINPAVLGFAAHATNFVMFFSLAGLVLLYRAFSKSKLLLYLISGLILGLAFLMKQPAIFFLLFGIFLFFKQYFNKSFQIKDLIKYSIIFITGFIFPLIMLVAILLIGGTFDRFWFWTFQYAIEYGALVSFSQGIENFMGTFTNIFHESYPFQILAVVGLLLLVIDKQRKFSRLEIILFFIVSFMAIIPGYYFREHYFVIIIPAVSILVTEGIFYLKNKIKFKNFPVVIFILVLMILVTLLSNSSYYLLDSPEIVNRKIYGANPFIESIPIAEFIASHTNPEDRVQVLGSEPQIYFYSNRLSASGYIYMYGLMEPQKYSSMMQHELMDDIERVNPKYIIYCNMQISWITDKSNYDYTIFKWNDNYLKNYYNIVGVVDMGEETIYKWMNDAVNYQPRSLSPIFIYERNSF